MDHSEKTFNFIRNYTTDIFVVRVDEKTNPYSKETLRFALEMLIVSSFPELVIDVEHQEPFEFKPVVLDPEELLSLEEEE